MVSVPDGAFMYCKYVFISGVQNILSHLCHFKVKDEVTKLYASNPWLEGHLTMWSQGLYSGFYSHEATNLKIHTVRPWVN